MYKIFLISNRNEQTGSCIAIKNLYDVLKVKNNIKVISSVGNLFNDFNFLKQTNFNIFKIIYNIYKLNKIIDKDGIFIFNTILSLPYLIFMLNVKRKYLYIHEQNLKPIILYKIVNKIINLFNLKVIVVNPLMMSRYKNCYLLSNSFIFQNEYKKIIKNDKEILMISNCYLGKGIQDFITLAINNMDYEFRLFTNKELMHEDCKNLLDAGIPDNLKLYYDQDKKNDYIRKAKYVLSLSYFNETFGLVLIESLINGTIPISVINDGSNYVLNKDSRVLYDREYLINNFKMIIHSCDQNYNKIYQDLYNFVAQEFNNKNLENQFWRILND